MNHNPYQQYPIDQQLKIEIVQLKKELFELQTKLMECNEQNFNLQATILTIETEAKFEAGQEAQKLQSELSFKNRELDEQNRELKKLMKELQELKQQNKSSNDSKSLSQNNSQFLTHIKSMPLATSSSSSSIPSIAPTIEPMRRSIKPFELQSSDGNILIQSLYQIFLEIVIFLSTTDMKINPDNPFTGRLPNNIFSSSKTSLVYPPPSSTHIKSILKKTTDKLTSCPDVMQPLLISIDQMLSSISLKLPLNEFKTSLPLIQLAVKLSMSLSNMLFSSNSLDQDCYNPQIQSYIQAFELSLQFIQLSISLYHFSQTKLQLQQHTNPANPLYSPKFLEITSEKRSKNINLMVQFDNIQTSKPSNTSLPSVPPSKSSSSSMTSSSSSRSTLSDSIQSIPPTSSKPTNKATDLLTKYVQFPSGIQPSLSKLFPLPNDPTNPLNHHNIQLFPMDLFELGLDFLYISLEKLDLLLLYLENIPIITKQSLLQQLIHCFSLWIQQYPLNQIEERIQQQLITMFCWLFEYSQHISSCKQQLLLVLFNILQDMNCYKYFLYDQLSFSDETIKLLTNNNTNTMTNEEPHYPHSNKHKHSNTNKSKHSSFSLLVILLQDLRHHSTDLSSDLFSYQSQIINFIFDLLQTKKRGFLPYLLSISRDMIWKSSSHTSKTTTSTSPLAPKPPTKKRKHNDFNNSDVDPHHQTQPEPQPDPQPEPQPEPAEVSFHPISNDHLLYDITTQEFPIQAYHREFYKIFILFWTFLWKLLDTLPIFPECYTIYHKQLIMMTKKATLIINMFLELLTPSLRKELTRDVYNDIEVFFYRNYLSSFPMTFKLTEQMTKEIEKLIDTQEP